jgi:hypothetical protein
VAEISWHVARVEEKNVYRVMVGKSLGKCPFGRQGGRKII